MESSMTKPNLFAFTALFISLSASSPSGADTSFYEGKTTTIVAGTKAGDVYDLYARLFAQYMPKYIPGKPNIIVQNMPGAGSMIAANYVHNVARQDGLTIGAIFPALYFDQIIVRPQVNFDWLDRESCDVEPSALHACGHVIQINCRHREEFG